jgi:parallel beta-helix repeat protein
MKNFLLTILIVLLPVTTYATNLEVGSGMPYTTIQAAVDVAQPGDTVLIHAGTYTNSTLISSSGATYLADDSSRYANVIFKNNGTSQDRITIKSYGDGDVFLDGQSSVEFNIYSISRQYYTVEGLKFKNAALTSVKFYGSQAKSLYLDNNTFTGTVSVPSAKGVEAKGNGLQVTNNTFTLPAAFTAIDAYYATDSIIARNTITGSQYGIYLHDYTDGSIIEYNILTANSGDSSGIFIRDADNLTVRRNLVKGSYVYSMIYYQDTTYKSSGAKINNNTIHCSGSAAGINELYTWAETNNNIIYNCNEGIVGINPVSLPSGQPSYNIVYGSNYRYSYGGSDRWPVGTGNTEVDPLFVNTGSDYRLQSGSPARDTGTLTTEIPESWGSSVDIGSFEWTSSGKNPYPPMNLQVE